MPAEGLISEKHTVLYKVLRFGLGSRFRSWFLCLMPFFFSRSSINITKRDPDVDCVLTVAHDRKCFTAAEYAKRYGLPLVTIFHDWYPASSGANQKLLYFLNKEFRALYCASTLAFCVSPEMKEKLGPHSNSHILYPVPSNANNILEKQNTSYNSSINIFYAGFCGGSYKKMLIEIINEVEQRSEFKLHISGTETDKLITTTSKLTKTHINPFISETDFSKYLTNANVFLILIDFNKEKKLHFSTHFPSKIVEYAQHQKLIAIWAPEYSTAVSWAKRSGAAFYYNDPNIKKFLDNLIINYNDIQICTKYIQNLRRESATEFNHNEIHKIFYSNVKRVTHEIQN
jgi:hypothetical protein